VFDPSCFLIGNRENAGHEMQNVKTENGGPNCTTWKCKTLTSQHFNSKYAGREISEIENASHVNVLCANVNVE